MVAVILIGHVLDQLAIVSAESVHCCVTSIPYWGLRAYGTAPQVWPNGWVGEYGSEPTIDGFVANSVAVFSAVKRVLRDDGLLWLNIGDSYNAYNSNRGPSPSLSAAADVARQNAGGQNGAINLRDGNGGSGGVSPVRIGDAESATEVGGSGHKVLERGRTAPNLKAGDLCNIPNRVAMALQADGWYWRQTIVWNKPAPMPESVQGWRWERCKVKTASATMLDNGKNGSHIDRRKVGFNERYDNPEENAAKFTGCSGCPKCEANDGYVLRKGRWRCTNSWESIFLFAKSDEYFCDGERVKELAAYAASGLASKKRGEFGGKGSAMDGREPFKAITEKRNPRSVWTISPEPFKGAHFATFPGMLPYRCIQASTSEGGCCSACGSQYAPVVEKQRVATRPGLDNQIDATGMANRDPERHIQISKVHGYRPTCRCNAEVGRPVVLDPFLGSGTTAAVAEYLNCDWIGCELNPDYAEIARQRIAGGWKPREKKTKKPKRRKVQAFQKDLFT